MKYLLPELLFAACVCFARGEADHIADAGKPIKQPAGQYLMRPVYGQPAPKLNLGKCVGVVLRINANDVFKTETPDFSKIDAAIKALPAGTVYQLEVLYGVGAPQRWKAQGVKWIKFAKPSPERPAGEMPVPWDAVAGKLYASDVARLAARFDSEVRCVAVHAAHPVMFSAELHMPAEIARTPGWQAKLTDAWKASIDAHAAAFKQTSTVLDLSVTVPQQDANCAVARDVLAYAEAKLGPRLTVQENAWSAKPDHVKHVPYLLVKDAAARGVNAQLEELCGSAYPRFGGTFAQAKRIGGFSNSFIVYPNDQR